MVLACICCLGSYIAAAFAYQGHAGSVKDSVQKKEIHQIEIDEWNHREEVLMIMTDFGIPISSGLYMIHVRANLWNATAQEYVEKDKVIKWFGSLRPIDLDTF